MPSPLVTGKPAHDNPAVQRRATVLVTLALVLAAPASLADISPPAGRRWIAERGTTIVNADEHPDWVLVAWPCRPEVHVSLDSYCIPKKGESLHADSLYAIAKKDVTLGVREKDTPFIERPEISSESQFFLKDPRVVRPPFALSRTSFRSTVDGLGVVGAWYFARIDAIDAKTGVTGRFVRVKYECRSGATVELEWGPNQEEAPLPRCPVTNDRGERVPVSDAPLPGEGTIVDVRPPPSRARTIWLGVMIASLGLIGVAALWRKQQS
jgi:hypothetical protein